MTRSPSFLRTPGPVRQVGFTLIELLIALVVLAAATAGVLLIFANATAHSADPQVRAQARAIAKSYMDESLLQPYTDPDGSDAGETRSSYDDVWDYDAINNQDPPKDQFNNPIGNLTGYSVSVSVNGTKGSTPARITVTVTHGSQVSYSLYSERADY